MSTIYSFAFAPPAAGATVTVTDQSGTEVADEALGTTVGEDGAITLSVALPEGNYTGTVTGSFGTWTTNGILDVPESLESSGVGADETAYFVATGPVYATDGAGAAGSLNFVADPRHGTLPDWASLSSGDIALDPEAGTCAYSFVGFLNCDFSETTPPDSEGTIDPPGFFLHFDAVNVAVPGGNAIPGDGEDEQVTATCSAGGTLAALSVTADAAPSATSDGEVTIDDGEATPSVALTITRIAQAAVLPE